MATNHEIGGEGRRGYRLAIGIAMGFAIGIAGGTAFGAAFDSVETGMGVGVGVGMGLGAAFGIIWGRSGASRWSPPNQRLHQTGGARRLSQIPSFLSPASA